MTIGNVRAQRHLRIRPDHHGGRHPVRTGHQQPGQIQPGPGHPRIRADNGVWEYVLAWADETQIDRDIVLTEIDIENLIRAKGAIYSGCITLLNEEVGLQDRTSTGSSWPADSAAMWIWKRP
jgi:hypothetical protein